MCIERKSSDDEEENSDDGSRDHKKKVSTTEFIYIIHWITNVALCDTIEIKTQA